MKKRLLLLASLVAGTAYAQTFGSSSPVIWSGSYGDVLPSSGLSLKNQRATRYYELSSNGTATVDVKAPADLQDTSVILTWPDDAGTTDVILTGQSGGTVQNKLFDTTNAFQLTDGNSSIRNQSDPTKIVSFDISNITASTTRTVQFPNAATQTLVGATATQTLTGKTIDGNSNTLTVLAASQLSGVAPLANGGTNKNMTAVNGGVVWTDSNSQEVTAAGTSNQVLISAGAASPTWGLIANANVDSAAAIAGSKIAAATSSATGTVSREEDVTEGDLGTLTISGTWTPDSKKYKCNRVGGVTHFWTRLESASGGTTVTQVQFALPAACPTPARFSTTGSSEIQMTGSATGLANPGTIPTGTAANAAAYLYWDGSNYLVYITMTSVSARLVTAQLTYYN